MGACCWPAAAAGPAAAQGGEGRDRKGGEGGDFSAPRPPPGPVGWAEEEHLSSPPHPSHPPPTPPPTPDCPSSPPPPHSSVVYLDEPSTVRGVGGGGVQGGREGGRLRPGREGTVGLGNNQPRGHRRPPAPSPPLPPSHPTLRPAHAQGLDPASRKTLWEVVRANKAGRALILTTHSMQEAEMLCDRLGIFGGPRLGRRGRTCACVRGQPGRLCGVHERRRGPMGTTTPHHHHH
jgi:hypothetical protein